MKITAMAIENAKKVKAVSFTPKASGATVIGGCCGTDPGYISALAEMLAQRQPVQAVAHVVDHVQVREQRVALEHQAHIALRRAEGGKVLPVDEDATRRG